jgi:hypothetical protein
MIARKTLGASLSTSTPTPDVGRRTRASATTERASHTACPPASCPPRPPPRSPACRRRHADASDTHPAATDTWKVSSSVDVDTHGHRPRPPSLLPPHPPYPYPARIYRGSLGDRGPTGPRSPRGGGAERRRSDSDDETGSSLPPQSSRAREMRRRARLPVVAGWWWRCCPRQRPCESCPWRRPASLALSRLGAAGQIPTGARCAPASGYPGRAANRRGAAASPRLW